MIQVKVPFVDLKAQYQSIQDEIDQTLLNALGQAQFVGGDLVVSFERKFADYMGAAYCITCGNGTDALEIVLKALEIGPEDEVIVPANSWISTAAAVTHVGAVPVFVDVLPNEYNLNPDLLDQAITSKTKCIIPVHFAGLPARMNAVLSIADKHGLFVVEDCAQAHGTRIDERKVGNVGIAGTYSFYPSKNLGAYGDGGCIVTENEQLAEKLRRVGNHGQIQKHDHAFVGRNSRLDSLQAAILEVKLPYLDRWNHQRQLVAQWYQQYLNPIVGQPTIPEGFNHIFHLYMIRVARRDELRDILANKGIMTGIHYPNPIPFTEAYRYLGCKPENFPVSITLSNEILSLPMYPELSEQQVRYVANTINEFVTKN